MFLLKYISINLFNICGIVELAVSDRAPPVADAARVGKAQRSKFRERKANLRILAPQESHRFLKLNICGYGGIGRHARFRILCPQACRFDPCYPHHNSQHSLIQRKSLLQGLSLILYDRFMLQPNNNHTKNETLNLRVSHFYIKVLHRCKTLY